MASDTESKTTHRDAGRSAATGRPRRGGRKGFVVLEAESGLEALIEKLRQRSQGSR